MTAMLELQLPAGPEAASEARIALGDLELGLSAELLRDVRLMVSELVTNSIRHAGVNDRESVVLRAWLTDDRVGIEVADGGPGFEPPVTPGDEDGVGGWGLYIVQSLADRWGTSYGDAMSRVWFEIDIRDREVRVAGEGHRRSRASEAGRGVTGPRLEPQVDSGAGSWLRSPRGLVSA
jgi:anti-sigma regulatory factor (Ser/Thr protein kinase)